MGPRDCKRLSYLLKVGDDTFARLDVLESELRNRNGGKLLYWGPVTRRERPHREGQWAEKRWDICEMFLPLYIWCLQSWFILLQLVQMALSSIAAMRMCLLGAWVSPFELELKHSTIGSDPAIEDNMYSNLVTVLHQGSNEKLEKMHLSMSAKNELCG